MKVFLFSIVGSCRVRKFDEKYGLNTNNRHIMAGVSNANAARLMSAFLRALNELSHGEQDPFSSGDDDIPEMQ